MLCLIDYFDNNEFGVIMRLSVLLSLLRALMPSILFNFWYLPFRQAIKLPILVYKPHFNSLRGKVKIETDTVHFGMIRLGFLSGNAYPNTGVTWYNRGTVVFRGRCWIGNNSHIVVTETGRVEFGERFSATTSLKIVSCYSVKFDFNVRVGWDVTIMDTNFHPICNTAKTKYSKAYGEVSIGKNTWIATQCLIMHSVQTPPCCIFAARSIVTAKGPFESYCLHGGSPLRILKQDVIRDFENDRIEYK